MDAHNLVHSLASTHVRSPFVKGLASHLAMVGVAIAAAGFVPNSAHAELNKAELKVLSLNLHGYHPMQEASRLMQNRQSKLRETLPHLHYFTLDELDRGHHQQLSVLARDFSSLRPDVIFLQEVGAGLPNSSKSCDEFYNQGGQDQLGKNSALRLQGRLALQGHSYTAALACRGNTGWQTFNDTFRNERILKSGHEGSAPSVVFDFDQNPYPGGILVEGTAILVRSPWVILDHFHYHRQVPGTQDRLFFQFARIKKPDDPRWYLIVNLHGGHKVVHFEQAVELKTAIADWILRQPDRRAFEGALIGGDFNARLYRPNQNSGEVSSVPWEISSKGDFDYGPRASDQAFEDLKNQLWALNLDPYYKPWASLGNSHWAWNRVVLAVERFKSFVRSPLHEVIKTREVLDEGRKSGLCRPSQDPNHHGACDTPSRIDFIFATPQFSVESMSILYGHNSFVSTQGTSDHPAVMVDLDID